MMSGRGREGGGGRREEESYLVPKLTRVIVGFSEIGPEISEIV
jgi:hypothetical protein